MPILTDFHMHSDHSADSTAKMEDMIKRSIDKGLKEICFTEHDDLDYPIYPDITPTTFTLDVPSYEKELMTLKEKYKDRITVRYGIEIGMQAHVANDNLQIVKESDFDFVIASQHLVDRRDPYFSDFWLPDTVENIFDRFFDLTLENMKLFPDFDVLGHLDYIARYVPEGDTTYSYERFRDKIDLILEYLVKNEKGLDLNSKAMAHDRNSSPNPSPEIIKRFHDLGGKIITFGSDAHSPERVACCFDRMQEITLSCGFTEYYSFEKRTPVPHKL